MKNQKKKIKAPFTRRQFVGSCAAGASMISLAPYLSLSGCKTSPDEIITNNYLPKISPSSTRPIIKASYDDKIHIDLTFPGFHESKKKLIIDGSQKIFDYVFIESLGWTAYSGRPELPYLGLLIHYPNYLEDPTPQINIQDESSHLIQNPKNIYPAQVILMDNKNFKDNYGDAEYNRSLYEDSSIENFPYEVVSGPDIIQFGYSRFLLLKVHPYVFHPNSKSATFHTNIQIDIEVTPKPETEMEVSYYYETPFINKTFNLEPEDLRIENPIPIHERIIDPWRDNDNVISLLNELPDNEYNYEKTGPDQLIIYDDAVEAGLEVAAMALQDHKMGMGLNVTLLKKSEYGNGTSYINELRQPLIVENIIKFPNLKDVILFGDYINIKPEILNRSIYFDPTPTQWSAESTSQNSQLVKKFYADYYSSALHRPIGDELIIGDLNLGRIPAKNEVEASLIVANIISYEDKRNGYNIREKVALAGYFQDTGKERYKPDGVASNDYIQTLEEIKLSIQNEVSVSTFYQLQDIRVAQSRLRYRNKEKIGEDILFLDDEECVESILEAFRSGENIIVHRDHGWMDGWSRPTLKIPDFWKLKNSESQNPKEKPSIVFNINCLSGHFMGEEGDLPPNLPDPSYDCFSEVLLKGTISPLYGRINLKCPAVVASVVESPTFHNDWFVKGMFERIYGNILGSPRNTSRHKLGDIMSFGKLILFTCMDNNSLSIYNCEIYQILGDPSIKI